MAVSERSLVSFAGWPLGLDNISNEAEVRPKALREATNVDIGRGGELHRRRGYTLIESTPVHSLFAVGSRLLVVAETYLHSFAPDTEDSTALVEVTPPDAPMSYALVDDKVYFTNGTQIGVYAVGADSAVLYLGVPDPGGQPVVSATVFGGLSAGQYQVAITLLAADGTESGATTAVAVSVPEGGGISLSDLPAALDGAATIRVYMSNPNGTKDELLHHSDYPMGTTAIQLGPQILGRALRTQFLSPLPAGQHIRLFHGRLFVAVDNVLVYSDPFRRHLFAPDDNFFVYPQRITALEPVEGGIFVASDQLYFLAGGDPKDFQQRRVYPVTVAEGSALQIPGSVFPSLQTTREVAYFYSSRGPMVGLPDGSVVFPLEGRVAGDMQAYGATMLREQEGIRQLVTSLYGSLDTSGFRASDYAVMTVKRNGVEL